jgi:hypothetical protein
MMAAPDDDCGLVGSAVNIGKKKNFVLALQNHRPGIRRRDSASVPRTGTRRTLRAGTTASNARVGRQLLNSDIARRRGTLQCSISAGENYPVFGHLHAKGLRRFTLRYSRKVDIQWKLFALAHNVQKLQGHVP